MNQNKKEKNYGEDTIDLIDLFFYYWERKWVLLLALIFGAAVAGTVTRYMISPIYSATSKLYVFTSSGGSLDLSSLQLSTNLTNDYVELIQTRPVVETVVSNLEKEYDYDTVLDMITVTNPDSTRFLYLTVQSTDPEEAMDMANELARVSSEQIAAMMNVEKPNVVEQAVLPDSPVSPSMSKNILMGGMAALLIVCGLYLIVYLLDDTMKSADDIEKYLGMNTLAVIPLTKGEKRERKNILLSLLRRKSGKGGKV